jgi:heterodisulfide reductase subunit A
VGNGIAGTQADLDLINPGFYFYLLEKSPATCGKLAQLNKTSPTNDSAMRIISPDLVKVDWIHHTNLPTCAELKNVTGRERYFQPRMPQRPSYADLSEGVNVL